MEIRPIAQIRSDFPTKFGVPRQSGMIGLKSYVVFTKEYSKDEAFKGLDGYDYVWLIWGFDRAEEKAKLTVRPPRLGGNVRMGVFATRSPFRPNGLALSSVRIEGLERTTEGNVVLVVSGGDMADGTPVYDVKPYLPYCDCHADARGGFAEGKEGRRLQVTFEKGVLDVFPEEKREALREVLSLDPRPSYHDDDRMYGFAFCGHEIKFTVTEGTIFVTHIEKTE